jgi:short-subunit dehydrogenase
MMPGVSSDLAGRVAAITGASAGIGRACAEALAARGVAVALSARRADRLTAVAAGIERAGGRALAVPGDVVEEAHAQRLVERAVAALGGLDIMICNAGIGYHGSLEETSAEVMRRLLDVNFMGTFHAARAALPIFRRQGRGHLLLVSSIVGRRGIGHLSGYSATKAAQVGFAEALRAELAGTGLHVSVVFPVATATEFHDAMRRDYGRAVAALGPKQTAAQVAAAVVACVQRPTAEVYPLRKARALVVLNALAPQLTDRIVRRYARSRRSAGP